MDPPPLPATTAAASAASMQLSYPESLESSPRSRNADSSWDVEPLPQVPGAKLRLMCSYGGHIIPRPHDKSLCYVGGETRIVVADRHSSLSDLCSRLSRTLLNGRPFTLKYLLPTEDLDSLISVTTDEDLDNLVEEYDRTTSSASPPKPSSRLRLFLFFSKPETAASMGALLDDAKSESWFVDALNGSGFLPRNLSDSAANLDCLLTGGSDSCNDLEAAAAAVNQGGDFFEANDSGKPNAAAPEVHSISESAFVENNTSSSSGSSTSSPCLANLPPIRVRMDGNVAGVVQGQKAAGIEEQFAQISFVNPPTMVASGALSTNSMAVGSGGGETMSRINSEDEIAAQNVPVAFRKPPLPMPLQPQHFKQGGGGGGYSLPSPDSVASDSSIASANSLSKPIYYQEQVQVASRDSRAPVSPNTASDASDQGSRNQVQDSGYSMLQQSDQQQQQQNQLQQQQVQQQHLLQQQYQQQQQLQQQHLQQQQQQQQQFVHASTQYMNIQHPATGQVPVSPYYTMYATPSQQQQLHHQIDHQQQYPVYIMPVPQSQQPYKMALQSNMADPTVASTRITSQTPAAYKDSIPPVYPPKAASPAMPEMTQSVYQTSVTPAPQLVQIPSNQYQQQFVGYPQMHHPSQSIAVPSSATTPNYAYEYANPSHEQVFYTQHQPAPLPPQYQSMTPAAAAAAVAMSDEAKQLAAYSAADQSHTQS